jgi:kynureninase
VQSQIQFHGFDPKDSLIQVFPREGEFILRTEDIEKVLEEKGESIALVLFSGVQYYTGQYFEIERITAMGHKKGCMVGWDLAHAVGNVDLQLHKWNVDFACWCSYKYLNGGPGTIGGCFVHQRHIARKDLPRLAGWWGHNLSTRFQMNSPTFDPIEGAHAWRLSNPPILCLAALFPSLLIFQEASMPKLRQKSILLTAYLERLLTIRLGNRLNIISPKDINQRGAQLSLLFNQDAAQLADRLQAQGVICDFRRPNVLRIAPAPLYNSFKDVFHFVSILERVLQ